MAGAASRTAPAVLRRLRRGIFRLAAASGLADRIRDSAWRRERLLILGYHGVALDDEHVWNPQLYITAEALRARLVRLLDAGHTVLPLAEAVRRLYAGTLPRASVVLTFDDGNHDFVARALPVLQELRLPATVYVTTFYTQRDHPVFDVILRYVAWKGRAAVRRPGAALVSDGEDLLVATADERAATTARIDAQCRYARLDAAARDAVVREFAARLGVDYDAILERRILRLMTPAEVATVERAGIDVQLHTHRHRCPADPVLFAREIEDNRAALGAAGAVTPRTHFCYPNGRVTADLLPVLSAAGVATATTCAPRLATRADHPLLLPRYVDCELQEPSSFDAWASGIADLLRPRGTGSLPHGHRDASLPRAVHVDAPIRTEDDPHATALSSPSASASAGSP